MTTMNELQRRIDQLEQINKDNKQAYILCEKFLAQQYDALVIENTKLRGLLAEKHDIYLDNCAEIDRLNNDIKQLKAMRAIVDSEKAF
jgi:hypothetical protein